MSSTEDGEKRVADPTPSVDRVMQLAQRIIDGDIRLPKFQREFVWTDSQIVDLLDSIANNFPIGSVLLWLSKEKLASERSIADLSIKDRPDEYPVNYLLDGQQRLSTICGALYWDSVNKDSSWNIYYDLREQQFHRHNELELPNLWSIRINTIPDASVYFERLNSFASVGLSDASELSERAKALFNRFVDYKIATVTLGDMSLESVGPIFERINSSGTHLTIVDLMRAATWSPKFDLVDTIDERILEELEGKGFGNIERKAVLRNMSSAAGGDFTAAGIDDLRDADEATLEKASQETVDAYKKAVDYLVTQLKVSNSSILPYINQIVVLAEFFRKVPSPSKAQFDSLQRWFWRTAVAGYFSGWNTGQMTADHSAVESFATGAIPDLEVSITKPSSDVWKSRQFRSNNAIAKVLGIVLCNNSPIDFLTGQDVEVGRALAWNNKREFHHVFPRAYLASNTEPRKINALANFALITSDTNKKISDQKPSEYFKEVRSELGDRFDDVMDSHFISPAAVAAAEADDYDAFLNARSHTLHSHISTLADW